MYFQITFDSDRIKEWFKMIPLHLFAFGVKHFTTKRRKRIITLWLLRKDLKYTRQARSEQIDRLFGNPLEEE